MFKKTLYIIYTITTVVLLTIISNISFAGELDAISRMIKAEESMDAVQAQCETDPEIKNYKMSVRIYIADKMKINLKEYFESKCCEAVSQSKINYLDVNTYCGTDIEEPLSFEEVSALILIKTSCRNDETNDIQSLLDALDDD